MADHNPMRQSGTGNHNGFTLIEVLISMVLLTVGLLGTVALLTGIMRGNTYSNRLTTATTLAQDKLEEVRRLGYSNTASSDTTDTEDYNAISGFPLYKRVTLTDTDSPAVNMKRITVTVYWDSGGGPVVLKTILSE